MKAITKVLAGGVVAAALFSAAPAAAQDYPDPYGYGYGSGANGVGQVSVLCCCEKHGRAPVDHSMYDWHAADANPSAAGRDRHALTVGADSI